MMSTTLRQKAIDYPLAVVFGLWLLIGLISLSSAGSATGIERFGDAFFFIKRQILFGLLPGIVLFFLCLRIPYLWFQRHAVWIFATSIALLVLVFIPGIGSRLNTGAASWIVFGGYSFQPAEIVKLTMILFLASILSRMTEDGRKSIRGFFVALGIGLVPILLILLQPDIGTVSLLFVILFGMLLLGGISWRYLGGLSLVGIAALIALVLLAPYRAARLTTFLHPELDPQGIGYHINQAFVGIGSGGWFGLGLGHSRQKFQYLPEVHADSIFAVMAEEMGLIFILLFLAIILAVSLRSLVIAKQSPDLFGRLVVGGIVLWLTAQAWMNIGAMIGLVPLTGIPLPLVSHGGTALMMNLAAIGMILNISRYRRPV